MDLKVKKTKGSDNMRCPMCGVGLAEIKYKDINICKECSKTLNSEVETFQ